jgi:hypothetical protein
MNDKGVCRTAPATLGLITTFLAMDRNITVLRGAKKETE